MSSFLRCIKRKCTKHWIISRVTWRLKQQSLIAMWFGTSKASPQWSLKLLESLVGNGFERRKGPEKWIWWKSFSASKDLLPRRVDGKTTRNSGEFINCENWDDKPIKPSAPRLFTSSRLNKFIRNRRIFQRARVSPRSKQASGAHVVCRSWRLSSSYHCGCFSLLILAESQILACAESPLNLCLLFFSWSLCSSFKLWKMFPGTAKTTRCLGINIHYVLKAKHARKTRIISSNARDCELSLCGRLQSKILEISSLMMFEFFFLFEIN
jgi:hypothetical protein